MGSCQINNEWVYSLISWYNMTPFYRVLLERLLRADHDEMVYLVRALHAMPRHSPQPLLSNHLFDSIYKRVDPRLQLDVLRKLEEVLCAPATFTKRRYYEKYLQ